MTEENRAGRQLFMTGTCCLRFSDARRNFERGIAEERSPSPGMRTGRLREGRPIPPASARKTDTL
jgi:hypothetical protein